MGKRSKNKRAHVSPDIIENYKEYTPPIDILPTINRALRIVPNNYLAGLDRIVLTDAEGLPRRRRREKTWSRKKKVPINEALGLHSGGHIEIFIDNIIDPKRNLFYFQRKWYLFEITRVLFHEIGHHIHRTKCPEHREPENVADEYMRLYWNKFMR